MHTTLNKLKAVRACPDRYKHLRMSLGGPGHNHEALIPLLYILDNNGLNDTLWALRATVEPSETLSRVLACDYAARVLPIWETEYPDDMRPRGAIDVARRYAGGAATEEELQFAARAAGAAAWSSGAAMNASGAAWAAVRAADTAACAAADTAACAAAEAAWNAACAAAFAAAGAAWNAGAAGDAAAAEAAWNAAFAAERNEQERILRQMLKELAALRGTKP